jgi:cytochrome P450
MTDTVIHVPSTKPSGSLVGVRDHDPVPWIERTRELGDVVWDEELGAWLILSVDLVKQVCRSDIEAWTNPWLDPRYPPPGVDPADWHKLGSGGKAWPLGHKEGEIQERVHAWWVKVFSQRRLKQWREELFRPVANAVVDGFIGRGRAELVKDYIEIVTPRMVTALLGLPTDQEWLDRFLELGRRRQRFRLDPRQSLLHAAFESEEDQQLIRDSLVARDEQEAMLRPFIEERRAGTGTGIELISLIWQDAPEIFGDDFVDEDVIGLALEVPESAVQTTIAGTANVLYALMTEPSLRDFSATDDASIAAVVEEAMRLYPPGQYRPRIAKQDFRLGDVEIKQGEMVVCMLNAANRDERKFACPAEFDLERPAPRAHLTFFQGPRACPGQALARVEMQELTRVIVDRLRDLRLDPDCEPPAFPGLVLRRFTPLHVLFRAG